MVIWKYILLLSFFEVIYKKWDVTKKYKNVLNSVIMDYFVHYQMFTIISCTNNFKTKKMVMHVIQYLEQLLNSKVSDSAFTNLENFLGIQQQNEKWNYFHGL